jgi:hypothetical protein
MISENIGRIIKKKWKDVSTDDWDDVCIAYIDAVEIFCKYFDKAESEVVDIMEAANYKSMDEDAWSRLKKILPPFLEKEQIGELMLKESRRFNQLAAPESDSDSGGYESIARKIREEEGLN